MSKKRGEIILTIGSETVGFKFGINAFAMYKEDFGESDFNQKTDDSQSILAKLPILKRIMLCGAKAYLFSKGEPADHLNEWIIGDYIDEMDDKDMEKILSVMTESKFMGGGDKEKKDKPKK